MSSVKSLVFLLFLLTGCDSGGGQTPRQSRQEFRTLVASVVAIETLTDSAPKPPVSEKCDACNGTGRVGDGTISRVCGDCGGTGKKKSQAGYPTDDLACRCNGKLLKDGGNDCGCSFGGICRCQ